MMQSLLSLSDKFEDVVEGDTPLTPTSSGSVLTKGNKRSKLSQNSKLIPNWSSQIDAPGKTH